MVCGFRDAAKKKIRLAVPQDKGWEFIYTQGKRSKYGTGNTTFQGSLLLYYRPLLKLKTWGWIFGDQHKAKLSHVCDENNGF
jgi:hypothetical protein